MLYYKYNKGKEVDTMKETGIVRRIDDLGRIVIPKEIRRTLRIREGDPLEIFLPEDGGIAFKKYSRMGYNEDAIRTVKQVAAMSKMTIGVYDTDGPISVPTSFPRFIPDDWFDHGTEPFHESAYYVCSVFSNGERLGFVVSDKGGAELTMIVRFLSATLSDN